jgi:flagellar biogenesis protein FliO
MPPSDEATLLHGLNNTTTPATGAGAGLEVWPVIFNLLLVLVLIVVVLRLLRPWLLSQKGLQPIDSANRVQVLNSRRLGGGHAVHVVQVRDTTVLVGTGPNGSPMALTVWPPEPSV